MHTHLGLQAMLVVQAAEPRPTVIIRQGWAVHQLGARATEVAMVDLHNIMEAAAVVPAWPGQIQIQQPMEVLVCSMLYWVQAIIGEVAVVVLVTA